MWALVAALGAFLLGLSFVRRPPEWLKREWLKTAERTGRLEPEDAAVARAGGFVPVPRLQYWLGWTLIVVVLVLWLVFDWPASILTEVWRRPHRSSARSLPARWGARCA